MLHIRLLRGCLVCLVRLPGSAPVGGLRVAVIASPRLPHLRCWRLYPGQRAAVRFPSLPPRA
jgi:hypothetical protein